MSYNLDENAAESFEFILGGNTYSMRYPNTEEIEASQKIKGTDERVKWMYDFIEPVTANAPAIADAIKKTKIPVMRKFNKMIEKEFAGDE